LQTKSKRSKKNRKKYFNKNVGRAWSVILAIREAEIGRIVVRSQPCAKSQGDPISTNH
jgi:hypothetical protein